MQEKKSLAQITADTLRKQILEEKKYKVNEKLPNENELSSTL